MPSSIEFLGRKVRLNEGYQVGHIGLDGRQIGKIREIEAGTIGIVTSHRPGLTVRFDDGLSITVPKNSVTLLPRY